MKINSTEKTDIVIAGTGIAASFSALFLIKFGFRPLLLGRRYGNNFGGESIPRSILRWHSVIDIAQILKRAEAVVNDGFKVEFVDRRTFDKSNSVFHVDRGALARAALDHARDQNASILFVEKLPLLNCRQERVDFVLEETGNSFPYAVDATGRRAQWSRPVGREGKSVAKLLHFPRKKKTSVGKVVIFDKERWAYRIDLPNMTTVGIVFEPKDKCDFYQMALKKLNVKEIDGRSAGNRPAFPQWAEEPCVNGRIFAVGDAAFSHNPIAGNGISFAVASAYTLAVVLRTCREFPKNAILACDFYREFVASEKHRHLSFLNTFDAHENIVEDDEKLFNAPAFLPGTLYKFSATVQISGIQRDGFIVPEETIVLNNGEKVRWLGEFDLLHLRKICEPSSFSTVLEFLEKLNVSSLRAKKLLSWCVINGVLEMLNPE